MTRTTSELAPPLQTSVLVPRPSLWTLSSMGESVEGTSLCFNSGYTGKAISTWVDFLNPSHWPVDALSIVEPHEGNVTCLQRLTFYARLLNKLAEILLSKPAPQLLSNRSQCFTRIFSLLESTRSKSGTPVCLRSCKNKEGVNGISSSISSER
ncbi:hypothetical protein AVEN_230638-1 [Araneus ventricosus]|uniref:Uncharacterized protein n=1 Tax=Araneus ventricosus TaxID=182803 RepID=A0A4Y2A1L7_ARAVE|nr:hypothetical protein AVEN_230638-1 [Araneus ventricosus]